MSATRIRVLVVIASFAFILAGVASLAAASPGGWAVWRALLFAWPLALAFSLLMATYPGISEYDEDRQRRLAALSPSGTGGQT